MVIPATNTSVRVSAPYWDPRDRAGTPWRVTVKRGVIVDTHRFAFRKDAEHWARNTGRSQAFQASLQGVRGA